MKIIKIICFFSLTTYCFIINAGFKEWLDATIISVKGIVQYIGDDIELQFGWLAAKEPQKYKNFKTTSDNLQKQIRVHLDAFEKTDNTDELKKSEQLLDQLLKEHEQLLVDAKTTLSQADYKKLQQAIELRQLHIQTAFEKLDIKAALEKLWQRYGPKNKSELNKKNIYKNSVAEVINSATLPEKEVQFLAARKDFLEIGQKKFFEMDIARDQLKTIGFVGTGGGYRALILTLGYLAALEDMKLLHGISYITSLSGSTWLLGPWMLIGGDIKFMKNYIFSLIKDKYFDLANVATKMDMKQFINDAIWPKFVFGQPVDSVDLFGGLLAGALLHYYRQYAHQKHLSDQWNMISEGNYPFPIYTSVSMHKLEKNYIYNWYEFTPLEVRNLELNLAIPSYAFNWEFSQGKSIFAAPEQSFGFLMGVFGSAYSVNAKDLNRIMFSKVAKEEKLLKSTLDKIKFKITETIMNMVSEIPKIGTLRISPAQINNPFKDISTIMVKGDQSWVIKRDYLVFVDGGIDYNIPVRPLFRPERNVQAIIIGESSANVEAAADLKKLFADIQRVYGYSYDRIDDGSNSTLRLYQDKEHVAAPVIVYTNFLKDDKLIKEAMQDPELKKIIETHHLDTFDPVKCVQKSFCDTFNFNYTTEEFLQLCAMAELNMKANKKAIAQFLKQTLFGQ